MNSLQKEFRKKKGSAHRLLILSDFDGTLSPIIKNPDAVKLSGRTLRALRALRRIENVKLIILSGRDQGDLEKRIPLREVDLIGEHGLPFEPGVNRRRQKAGLASLARELRLEISAEPNARIELKDRSATIHFRGVPGRRQARFQRRIKRLLRSSPQAPSFRLREGKKILEVLPRTNWGKGAMAEKLARNAGPGVMVLALGDDATDEEMFRALGKRALTVKVGRGESAARFRLSNSQKVTVFLEWLVKEIS